jgi:DNA-binding SARP family transcriptional activator/streptogramin lyase
VEFRILGPLELVEDGRQVELSGGRQRKLLVLLLVHAGEVVSTDRLIDGLWGERPPASAAKVLQNAISQLRRSLGEKLIVTRAPGYVLVADPETIDAHRFESLFVEGKSELAAGDPSEAAGILRESLAVWRGPALDEFAYEPFAEAEAARLEELRLRALEERIDADLALGRHADLIGELERFVAAHPLRERPRGQLMLALYRSGRQAEALRVYQEGRRLLAEELGLEPGGALRQLEQQIISQDPVLEAPTTVPLPREERRREAAAGSSPGRPRRRLAVALAAIAVAAVALVTGLLLITRDDARPAPTVVPNSVVKIDPKSGKIVDVFRVGREPYKPAIVGDYVFVSSIDDGTLSRIDVRSGEVDTYGRLTSPAGLAAGAPGTLWVGSLEESQVRQIDADDFQLRQVIQFSEGTRPWSVALGAGSIWVSQNSPAAVSRFRAATGERQQRYLPTFSKPYQYSAETAFGEGAAWTAVNSIGQSGVLRIDALGGGTQQIEVGEIPYSLTVGFGAVWVTDLVDEPEVNAPPEPGTLLRIDAVTGNLDAVIPVGKRPTGVATGQGSVWVANGGEKTISQIDPPTNEVVDTIPMRYYPGSVAYGHGFLWVSLHDRPFSF